MNNFSLLIDGNNFMHISLSALGAFSSKNKCFDTKNTDDENRQDVNSFLDRLSTIFASDVRNFGSLINKVIVFIDDSRSWRKDYLSDSGYLGLPNNLDYKGNRKKDKTINWELIYNTFNHFLDGLNKNANVVVKSINGCESDDLIAFYSSYMNSIGENVLIYSSDNDLKQCINFNKSTNGITMQYQKQNKGVYLDRDAALYLKDNKETLLVDYIKSFCNNTKSKLTVVNKLDIIFEKVIVGDSGDNIFPVMSEMRMYKSGKKEGELYESKISETIANKIKEGLEFSVDDFYSDEFIDILSQKCLDNYKTINTTFTKEQVFNNIKTNVNLVILDKRSLPTPLYENIIDWLEDFNKKQQEDKKCFIFDNKKCFTNKQILTYFSMYDKRLSESASSASIFKHLGL